MCSNKPFQPKKKHAYLSHTLMPCHHVGVQASQKYPSRLHSAHQGNDRWSRLTNRISSWLRLERSMLPSCSFKNKQLHLPWDDQKWGLKKLFYHQNSWMRFYTKPLYWMSIWGYSTALKGSNKIHPWQTNCTFALFNMVFFLLDQISETTAKFRLKTSFSIC